MKTSPHITISQKESRQLALRCQGLALKSESTLQAIEQLGYVQIDTISVTERSHNHVLFVRNPSFKQKELTKLMDNKSIFEYWSHAAAYLPMREFRFSLYKKNQYRNGENHWFPREKRFENYVLDRLKSEGPLQSKDFESPKNANPKWYEWKPAKIALSNLFMDGTIMIANRKGFQKIYDITERVVLDYVDTTVPTESEYCMYLVRSALNAHGILTLQEIGYLRKGITNGLNRVLETMVEDGKIIPVRIDGNDKPYYANSSEIELTSLNQSPRNQVHILNPFDNLIIQRNRLKQIFNFDYQIECYVPEGKRKFGYYTLPVLFGNQFVARFDAKADRKTGTFEVKQFWYEPGIKPSQEFRNKFETKLNRFAKFCGCEAVHWKQKNL